MKSVSDNLRHPQKMARTVPNGAYAPNRPGLRPVQLEALMWGVVLAWAISMFLIVALARPVWSQPVALVKVDMAVVSSGYRASRLIGNSVTNDRNERIGTLDDLVIARNNHDLFAILQVGGFLGIGGRLVAVPYSSLKIDDNGNKIELPGASKDTLLNLTEFKYRT
jgi:sporulation protein YlmC with PRC-barrel domain